MGTVPKADEEIRIYIQVPPPTPPQDSVRLDIRSPKKQEERWIPGAGCSLSSSSCSLSAEQ